MKSTFSVTGSRGWPQADTCLKFCTLQNIDQLIWDYSNNTR